MLKGPCDSWDRCVDFSRRIISVRTLVRNRYNNKGNVRIVCLNRCLRFGFLSMCVRNVCQTGLHEIFYDFWEFWRVGVVIEPNL